MVKSADSSFGPLVLGASLARIVPLRVFLRILAGAIEASGLLCLSPVDLLHRLAICLQQASLFTV